MSGPETPDGSDQSSEKDNNTEQLRYTPPDYYKRMVDIALVRRQAIERLHAMGVIGGPELDAVNEEAEMQFSQEAERAIEHLTAIEEPLIVEPSPEQWGTVEVKTGKVRVPFIQREVDEIIAARKARQWLMEEGMRTSGDERDFWTGSRQFPNLLRRDPLSTSLEYRPSAVWGIVTSAKAAEDALTKYEGTAYEPRGKSAANLIIVRDLPEKLIAHKPTSK